MVSETFLEFMQFRHDLELKTAIMAVEQYSA